MGLPLSAEKLVERAVRNATPRLNGKFPRWAVVVDTFGLGSTYAHDLCREYGLDPDEIIKSPRRTIS